MKDEVQGCDCEFPFCRHGRAAGACMFCALSAPVGEPDDCASVLDGIRDALEQRGFFHMANGRDIGLLLDERPPAPAVGAEKIRAACIEHASLNMTVEAAHNQADRITNAILSLLSGQGGGK